MISIIRTKTLAALRERAAREERAATTSAVLSPRALALEAGVHLTGKYQRDCPHVVAAHARAVEKWLEPGYAAAADLEARVTALSRLLADWRTVGRYPSYASTLTDAAEQYYQLLAAPVSDTRPAASLSTDPPRDGASHQNAGAYR